MALATALFTVNSYPNGTDNTQRIQRHYGKVSFVGASPSYQLGGIRVNFSPLESIKSGVLLPLWVDVYSVSGSGFDYSWNPTGAPITNVSLTANVVTITAHNNLAAGDTVLISGVTTATFLNGQVLTVLAGGLSATAFTANFTHGNYGSAADTGFALPQVYASGLPFQGNLQFFTSNGAAPAALAEYPTQALGVTIVGNATNNADVIYFRGDFVRN